MGCHGWTPQVVTGLGNTALLEEGGCEKEGGGPGFVPEPLSESHRINTTRAKIFLSISKLSSSVTHHSAASEQLSSSYNTREFMCPRP